jgi:hypothetical protein
MASGVPRTPHVSDVRHPGSPLGGTSSTGEFCGKLGRSYAVDPAAKVVKGK